MGGEKLIEEILRRRRSGFVVRLTSEARAVVANTAVRLRDLGIGQANGVLNILGHLDAPADTDHLLL